MRGIIREGRFGSVREIFFPERVLYRYPRREGGKKKGSPNLLKFIFFILVAGIVEFIFSDKALAWGPGIHTVTALSSLEGIEQILPAIARVISAYPLQYLYGCLSADFFIGKTQRKNEAHPHNWEGGFRLLGEAGNDREAAYAYGFLSHLAADVLAHNFFVPNLINSYYAKRRMGHLYWEIKADYLVGPIYTRIAKDVLNMEHLVCDDLLKQVMGKKRKGLRTKKRIYTQTVRISDYLYATHPILFAGKPVPPQAFHEYLAVMVNLSCRLVKDFLTHPHSSPCLFQDTLGKENLRLAKGNRFLPRMFRIHRPAPRFIVDQDILDL
jgi:hypothetical protein